jgi:peptidyl-prolyl cis-trans isomerase A (cyclophilin A)
MVPGHEKIRAMLKPAHRALATFTIVLGLVLGAFLDAAPAQARPRKPKGEPRFAVKEQATGDLFATFKTSVGDIVVKLYEADAPKTVQNFVALATGKKEWKNPATGKWEQGKPLYDGTFFHRVIPKFMIQGGDPLSGKGGDPSRAGTGGPGYRFEDELGNGHRFDKGGYLAMANSGPNTNGSQFFITEVPTPHLDDRHTIFGEVVSGMELVPKIALAGNMKIELTRLEIVRGKLSPVK